MNLKENHIGSSLRLLLVLAVIFSLPYAFYSAEFTPHEAKAGTGDNLSGYAWSDNIGWISFNCTDVGTCATADYGVNVDTGTGNFSGYAWSDNVGWISFNETAGCPEAGCTTQPKVDLSTGAVSGWARALANGGGWDGWIKLGGPWSPSVTFSGTESTGYSWGSDVVGWVSWSGSGYGVVSNTNLLSTTPTVTLTASPNPVDAGQSTILTWESTGATTCTNSAGEGVAGFSTDGATEGSDETNALTENPSNFSITCTGPGSPPDATDNESVTVLSPLADIAADPERVSSGGSSSISWSASQVTSCTVTGPSGTLASGPADVDGNFTTGSPTSVTITAQSTFTITCETTNGSPASDFVIVNINLVVETF